MIYILISISLLLEGLLSIVLPFSLNNISSFTPLFTVVSLVIVFPYFNNQLKKYILVCSIVGFIYDIMFTDAFLFTVIAFIVTGYMINFIYAYFVNNIYNTLAISIVVIVLYIIITYLLLVVLNYIEFNIGYLFYKIVKSVIINVIYVLVIYPILTYIADKYHIKRLI